MHYRALGERCPALAAILLHYREWYRGYAGQGRKLTVIRCICQ